MHRRDLLALGAAAGGLSMVAGESVNAAVPPVIDEIIDTNVHLFQWPFRRLPLDQPQALVAKLRSLGITTAWAGSYEGLLHRDVRGVNERLVEACRGIPSLIPIGTINLALPGWQQAWERCTDTHRMPGVRLFPSYHGYLLSDRRFEQLLRRAAEFNRFVQVVVTIEDRRTQHPLVQVPEVDLRPLAAAMRAHPKAKVQLLGARLSDAQLRGFAEIDRLYIDTARVEATDGVRNVIDQFSSQRVCFGSGAPFLIPEAALIRVGESNLDATRSTDLLNSNAKALQAVSH